jgi:hypothetical protein
MMLPSPLVWVLNLIGVNWPDIDEDDLRTGATELRSVAAELESNTGDAKNSVGKMLAGNSSQSLALFDALWSKIADGHLPQLKEALGLLADGLDVSAVVVVGLKVGAIVQLVALAAEIIADEAAAPFTFGASEAAVPVEIAATRAITKELVDQAVNAVEGQLMDVVSGAVFNALGAAGGELATELVGDAVGAGHGVDLAGAAKAGMQSGLDGLDPFSAGQHQPA